MGEVYLLASRRAKRTAPAVQQLTCFHDVSPRSRDKVNWCCENGDEQWLRKEISRLRAMRGLDSGRLRSPRIRGIASINTGIRFVRISDFHMAKCPPHPSTQRGPDRRENAHGHADNHATIDHKTHQRKIGEQLAVRVAQYQCNPHLCVRNDSLAPSAVSTIENATCTPTRATNATRAGASNTDAPVR